MGKGGMRWGAGRPGWHVKAEHCRRLDVRRWHREGLLRPGTSSAWVWTDAESGERRASIGFSVAAYSVNLSFNLNGEPITQHVPLDRTPCTYGGVRPWFRCPKCSRRVAVLFLRAAGFACRRCQRVAYASQSDDPCGRTWRKQSKLEARLAENLKRPRGMHRQTYERLLAVIWQCEEMRDCLLARYLGALMD